MGLAPWVGALFILCAACGADDGEKPPMLHEMSAPMADAGRSDAAPSDAGCSMPGVAGCSCAERGAVVECGKIVHQFGDYVTCSKGHSWCDGTTWSECIGDRFVTEPASDAVENADAGAEPTTQ